MRRFSARLLREKREAVGLTTAQLAVRATLHRPRPTVIRNDTIKRYERGERAPETDSLSALADALGCTMEDLCSEWGE